ncbi:MAG: tRNA (adenosine(37)-N6)-threonylcarbamoyltransferase complex ATPase subunit type 1 TsaE [Planctomycetota bacterium]
MRSIQFHSTSPAETERLGRELGMLAFPGLVVGLSGSLGAGKTTFVRGVAIGLEVPDRRLVTSPTFILIQEYPGRLPLYHFDTYRLTNIEDFPALGTDEYFHGDGVCLVEWADRVGQYLPPARIELRFIQAGETDRQVECTPIGEGMDEILTRWQSAANAT